MPEQLPNQQITKAQTILSSISPEYPDLGIFVLVVDARGIFATSSNIQPVTLADYLAHARKHVLGECKC